MVLEEKKKKKKKKKPNKNKFILQFSRYNKDIHKPKKGMMSPGFEMSGVKLPSWLSSKDLILFRN